MALFDDIAADADEILAELGGSVTLVKVARTAADSAQPWRGPSSAAVEAQLVVQAAGPFGEGDVDAGTPGTKKAEGAAALLVSAGEADLRTYTHANIGGELRRITGAFPLRPDGGATTVLWTLELS